jgi:hypothetical protein
MGKLHMVRFSIFVAFCFILSSGTAGAERAVKVYSVNGDGSLTLNRHGKVAEPQEEMSTDDDFLLIDDYEDGNLKNRLEGESGTWNLTPYDSNAYVDIETVEGMGAQGSVYALKVTYELSPNKSSKLGFWTKLMNLDATQYDHLAFDIRGDAAEGFTDTFILEIKKYKDKKKIDKIKGTRIIKNITSDWQTVEIPLNLFTGLFDQTNQAVWENPMLARKDLNEFVINLESRRVSKLQGAFYIDNIRLLHTGEPGLTIMDQPVQEGMKTPVRLEGVAYMKFLVERLGGFPSEVNPVKEFPEDDEAFLRMIAEDTWRFFDHIVDRESHLPLDTIQLGKETPISEAGWVGDYTNVTNIGLYLICLVSAYDLDFISREEAVRRIQNTLSVIQNLEAHESGFLYNYYDTTTQARTSYFVSLVDSGWLDAGIYVVKNAFPEELTEQSEQLLNRHNFSFFYDEVDQQFSHGYYAHIDVRSDYLYGSFYTEPRATSFLAIGRGDIPKEHWYRLVRTFPEEYPWQTQMPINRTTRVTDGIEYKGGYYEWKGIPFVPSWGGSMFEALMPTLIIDEAKYAPEGLGLNNLNYTKIHIKYTLDKLKFPVWGMSPSSVPKGGYSEFGVKVLGSKGYKRGVVTPHASILALEYASNEVIHNLRELIRLYPIYGEYGFYDAVSVWSGRVARKYLALDQAMILIALNNYLNDGAIRNRFHADPISKRALPLLTEEKFFDGSETRKT